MTPQQLEDRLIDFAVKVIEVVEALPSGVPAALAECHGLIAIFTSSTKTADGGQ